MHIVYIHWVSWYLSRKIYHKNYLTVFNEFWSQVAGALVNRLLYEHYIVVLPTLYAIPIYV